MIGLSLPLKLSPLLNVPLHGPVPVNAILKFAAPSLQKAVDPEITPVGRARTVTEALPLRSPAIEAQLASFNEAIVIVVEEAGETLTLLCATGRWLDLF